MHSYKKPLLCDGLKTENFTIIIKDIEIFNLKKRWNWKRYIPLRETQSKAFHTWKLHCDIIDVADCSVHSQLTHPPLQTHKDRSKFAHWKYRIVRFEDVKVLKCKKVTWSHW